MSRGEKKWESGEKGNIVTESGKNLKGVENEIKSVRKPALALAS